jgi:hypothetical protein
MDERGANIDLLFRNGLKDYEVLPPAEIWDNIHPSIKPVSRSFPLIRAAAAITIIISVSLLAYILTRETSVPSEIPVIAFNVESSSPVFAPKVEITETVVPVKVAYTEVPQKSLSAEAPASTIISENSYTAASEVSDKGETEKLASLKSSIQHGSYASEVLSPKNKSFNNA